MFASQRGGSVVASQRDGSGSKSERSSHVCEFPPGVLASPHRQIMFNRLILWSEPLDQRNWLRSGFGSLRCHTLAAHCLSEMGYMQRTIFRNTVHCMIACDKYGFFFFSISSSSSNIRIGNIALSVSQTAYPFGLDWNIDCLIANPNPCSVLIVYMLNYYMLMVWYGYVVNITW